MPLYEYKCQSCESVFEVMQKFADEPLITHEGCGGKLEKLISSPAFHLKGSGWYATDYAKGKSSDSNGQSSDSTKAESKTEAKPAAPASTSSDSSTKSS